jgi:hypothetical protein
VSNYEGLRHDHPDLITGLQLILVAFTLGYFVEKLYKAIGQRITNWIYLLIVLLLSYAAVAGCIFYANQNGPVYSFVG